MLLLHCKCSNITTNVVQERTGLCPCLCTVASWPSSSSHGVFVMVMQAQHCSASTVRHFHPLAWQRNYSQLQIFNERFCDQSFAYPPLCHGTGSNTDHTHDHQTGLDAGLVWCHHTIRFYTCKPSSVSRVAGVNNYDSRLQSCACIMLTTYPLDQGHRAPSLLPTLSLCLEVTMC
jgi:hypothetical protein